MNNWLQRMNYKFSRYSIENLMIYVVIGMAAVYIGTMLLPINLYSLMIFHWDSILQGQAWRLISFIFIPPNSSLIFIALALYFYYMLGSTLEHEWGTFKFNLYYLVGIIGTIIAGIITGYATNQYLNMSLFFAFAILYPNFTIRLFLVIPIRMKYLAYFNAFLYLIMFIQGNSSSRLSLLFSLLNLIIFFGGNIKTLSVQAYRRYKWRQNFK